MSKGKLSALLANAQNDYAKHEDVTMSFADYLDLCETDPGTYLNAQARLLKAIGEPEWVDTSKDPILGRIYGNKTIQVYPAFKDFYGMEEVIAQIVTFLRNASLGLEEKRQILYLLGPVGGGKSSLGDKIKKLIEQEPIYVLADEDGNLSPLNETPLGIMPDSLRAAMMEGGVPKHYFEKLYASPWAMKRLEEYGGDVSRFKVVKRYPSFLRQVAVSKTEPGDENNQDISALVGKVDIRMLDVHPQKDPDAYSFSGGLQLANQGVLEFVEMFKAPIKMLHPLITAGQDGNYAGTESIGAIPFTGLVFAHSNEAEWQSFRNNRNNEAFIDRIRVVKVPYSLRVSQEIKIYEKLLEGSELAMAPIAPGTLEMLARFSVLTRLKPHENSNPWTKMRIYDGEPLKDVDPKNAKTVTEYRDAAGVDEGMDGTSTRWAFKVLSETFNQNAQFGLEADPVHLMYTLQQAIIREQFPKDKETEYLNFVDALSKKYSEYLGHEIQKAYLESYRDYGQNLFDRYIAYADAWIEDLDFKDPDTGTMMNRDALERELQKLEKPAGVTNPRDFRNEVVKFALRARGSNAGNNPAWDSYQKMKEVIEKRMYATMDEILPVISGGAKKDAKTAEKRDEFVNRMVDRGYTPRQVETLVQWYMQLKMST